MSNIVVVPRFQKPWAITSAFNYAGTSTYPGLPVNLASLFTVFSITPLGFYYSIHATFGYSTVLPRS